MSRASSMFTLLGPYLKCKAADSIREITFCFLPFGTCPNNYWKVSLAVLWNCFFKTCPSSPGSLPWTSLQFFTCRKFIQLPQDYAQAGYSVGPRAVGWNRKGFILLTSISMLWNAMNARLEITEALRVEPEALFWVCQGKYLQS